MAQESARLGARGFPEAKLGWSTRFSDASPLRVTPTRSYTAP
jgi:hypothetical protein